MAERIVIDVAVGVARVRPEIASSAVRRAFRSWSMGQARLIVPRLFWLEIVNALGGRHRYPASEIAEALRELDESGLETVELGRPELLLVADSVERHRISAYDATYLVLARLLQAPLATLDRHLAAEAGPLAIFLGEEAPPRAREGFAPYDAASAELRPSSLPDYAGLGAYLGELRRRAAAGLP